MKKSELPINEIIDKYDKGITQSKIAEEYNTTQAQISYAIRSYYKKLGRDVPKSKNLGKNRIELPIEEIIEKYKRGISQPNLAKEYGVTQATISKRIIEYYKKIDEEKPKPKYNIEHPKKDLPIEEIIEKYKRGTSQSELAKEYGVASATISRRMIEYYKKTGKRKPERDFGKIKLPIKEIVKKYEKGSSPLTLAIEYGVSRTTILNRMNDYYKKIGKEKPRPKFERKYSKIELPLEETIKKYEEGYTTLKLSEEYNVSCSTIKNRIKEYYIILGKEKPIVQHRKDIPIQDIVRKYENGVIQSLLAKEYGVSCSTISARIEEYYQKTGKERPKRDYTKIKLPIEDIIEKYELGISQEQLALEYGVSHSTINQRLQEYYKKMGKEKPKRDFTTIKLPIEDIIKKYELGVDEATLAEEYDVAYSTIDKKIKEAYNESGRKKPKRLKSPTIIIDYLKRGLTIEEIVETASNRNIIIPKNVINDALNKVNNKNITDDNEER